jgi:hypothetical protein
MRSLVKVGLGVAVLAATAACANRPESIHASYVSHEKYAYLDCPALALTMSETKAELARMSKLQDEKATGDAIGVFLILVPVSKLTGDHEADVARLKGEVEAIETAQIKAKCKTLDSRAATPSASPSNAKE